MRVGVGRAEGAGPRVTSASGPRVTSASGSRVTSACGQPVASASGPTAATVSWPYGPPGTVDLWSPVHRTPTVTRTTVSRAVLVRR